FQFKLLSKSSFTKNSFSKEIYNSKICNTLILIYSKKKKEINSFFLTYNNLLIKNVNQYKNKKYYISPGITYCYDKNKITYINMSKKTQIIKRYFLSNQLKKLETTIKKYQKLLNKKHKIKINNILLFNKKSHSLNHFFKYQKNKTTFKQLIF
ncbi:hypothetical protein, partial [Candidatus Phytoplasma sp. AldY-WA1]|uniref:hypothetical protein n=1 Tax=Candidatus Phytoplasma sp. AldY-WA1 TaxID=2852100 RepID=UPI0025500DDE